MNKYKINQLKEKEENKNHRDNKKHIKKKKELKKNERTGNKVTQYWNKCLICPYFIKGCAAEGMGAGTRVAPFEYAMVD